MGAMADRFLIAYNRLDGELRERTRSDSDAPFSTVVERAEVGTRLATTSWLTRT
jgi:hypothetical protein